MPARRAILTTAALLLALGASSAAAAVRHVSPTGTGTACTAVAPCDLEEGVENALGTDQVVVAAGVYGSPSEPVPLNIPAGTDVRGAVIGPGRPVVFTSFDLSFSGDSRVEDLEVIGQFGAIGLDGDVRADRVVARAADGDACAVRGRATLSNSVCHQTTAATSAAGFQGDQASAVRNVTAVGGNHGVYVNGPNKAIANTIAVGGAGADVYANGSTVVMWHTYRESVTVPAGSLDVLFVAAGLAFRDAAAADFRQAPASTTVDRGDPLSADLPLDLNGNLRTVGAAPDIGAHEHVPAPAVAHGTPVTRLDGTATIPVRLDTRGGRTTLRIEYGTTPGVYPSRTADIVVPASAAGAGTVHVELAGLATDTTYVFRAVASSDGGETATAESPLRIPTAPTATVPRVAIVTALSVSLDADANTKGAGGTARFEVTPAAGGAAAATPDVAMPAVAGPRQFSATLNGLSPDTTYTAVAVVTTAGGTTRSAPIAFTTDRPPHPAPCSSGQERIGGVGPCVVVKVRPAGLTLGVGPGRDLRPPFRFRISGRLALLATVPSEVCRGRVRVVVKAGRRVLVRRLVTLRLVRGRCTYSTVATFRNRVRLRTAARLTVTATFLGNDRLLTRAASNRIARVR